MFCTNQYGSSFTYCDLRCVPLILFWKIGMCFSYKKMRPLKTRYVTGCVWVTHNNAYFLTGLLIHYSEYISCIWCRCTIFLFFPYLLYYVVISAHKRCCSFSFSLMTRKKDARLPLWWTAMNIMSMQHYNRHTTLHYNIVQILLE